jgi:uncharacterized lipoprotein YajG
VHQPRLHFRFARIDIISVWHLASLIALISTVVAFFAGCETTRTAQSDANSILQKSQNRDTHGEVGVMCGTSAR